MWDISKSIKLQYTLSSHTKRLANTVIVRIMVTAFSVTCVKWGGEGFIISASQDTTINVWKADDGALCRTLKV